MIDLQVFLSVIEIIIGKLHPFLSFKGRGKTRIIHCLYQAFVSGTSDGFHKDE